jgi:hypothetical protein
MGNIRASKTDRTNAIAICAMFPTTFQPMEEIVR